MRWRKAMWNTAWVVLSPGLAPTLPPAADLLREAEARGIEVVGEIELFARALADLAETREDRPRLRAVTGTNGKTTVTALTRDLIDASGLSVVAAGNISPAASGCWSCPASIWKRRAR
ncbi:hypothetical protein G6F22_020355 [Rhizopus arrhizus]|nr:hypothetical protein G6F22_020355 [Rhizopus arrhizus]